VQTVSRGWGDCKDKATVIVTLLKELGIDATIVIVRTLLRGDFDSKVASLAPFDHAIAYVPSLDLYLDGTAEWTGSTELPVMDRGALALKINKGNAELVRLPIGNPQDDLRRREVTVDLTETGRAALVMRQETRGAQAASWRRRYHADATLRDRAAEDIGREFPGFTLAAGDKGITTNDLTDLESPVTLTIRGSTERFARREGTDLTMDATANLRLSSTYASLSTRQLPVSIPPIGTVEETFVVKIPRGMKVRSAPMPTERKTEFGSYSITVESGGDRVTIRSRVAVGMREVKPADYAKWKTFCAEVDHAMSARLVIGPK
jgi:hypothetical protein